MNEKFFDLKKEKQDRMINAAIQIFALNGYRHSSTDDIVVAAQISKGLLFHYFGSKIGLYEFVYDYCVRFLSFELKSAISADETDYFNIMRASESAKKSVLKTYPYLQMFIDRSKFEEDENALFATEEQRDELQRIDVSKIVYFEADGNYTDIVIIPFWPYAALLSRQTASITQQRE